MVDLSVGATPATQPANRAASNGPTLTSGILMAGSHYSRMTKVANSPTAICRLAGALGLDRLGGIRDIVDLDRVIA